MNKAAPLLLIPVLLFVSCLSVSQVTADQREGADTAGSLRPEPGGGLTRTQELLLEGARYFLGADEIAYLGRTFPYDCSGLVMGIYFYADRDLYAEMAGYRGNAVSMIYQLLSDREELIEGKVPEPGDIIFWDNTYDYNSDGLWNDPLTHTGMVVSVSEWGTVDYIHLNYRKGIVIERMNLKEPDINRKTVNGEPVIVNSPMRMEGQPAGRGWLASHLFRAFGRGWNLGG